MACERGEYNTCIARRGQPLDKHLTDVGIRTKSKVEKRIGKEYGDLGYIVGAFHDLGKAEISIQSALKSEKRPKKSHAYWSYVFYFYYVKNYGLLNSYNIDEIILGGIAILTHHTIPHRDSFKNIKNRGVVGSRAEFSKEFLTRFFKKLDLPFSDRDLSEILKLGYNERVSDPFGIADGYINTRNIDIVNNSRRVFSVLYSSLVTSDWESSSGKTYSPLTFRSNSRDWISCWIRKYDYNLTDVHNFIFKNSIKDNMLLELPTGFGKTSAGILYALKSDKGRVIYTLPVTTIIEDVYNRLSKDFNQFSEMIDWYNSYSIAFKSDVNELDWDDLRFLRHLFKPITLTTLDQILIQALNIGRFPITEYSFENSTWILDEPQLYEPKMLAIFFETIDDYLENWNVNVAVMSATIPEFFKETLEELGFVTLPKDPRKYYQRLNRTYIIFRENMTLVTKNDENRYILTSDAIDTLLRLLSNHNKIIIKLNTVKKAQDVYDCLLELKKKKNLNFDVELFHSRYILKHRIHKLERLKELEKSLSKAIAVTTQVVEAGVDISFDAMLTELAPFPSIVQASGRVNRVKPKSSGAGCKPVIVFDLDAGDLRPYLSAEINTTRYLLSTQVEVPESKYFDLLSEYWQNNNILSMIYPKKNEAKKIVGLYRSYYGNTINESNFMDLKLRENGFTIQAIPKKYKKSVENILTKMEKFQEKFIPKIVQNIILHCVNVPIFMKVNGKRVIDLLEHHWKYEWIKFINLRYDSDKGLLPETQDDDYFI